MIKKIKFYIVEVNVKKVMHLHFITIYVHFNLIELICKK